MSDDTESSMRRDDFDISMRKTGATFKDTYNPKKKSELNGNKSASCPLQQVVESPKKTCEKSDSILDRNGFKSPEPSIAESDNLPGPSGYKKLMQPLPDDIPSSQLQKHNKIESPIKARNENLIAKEVQAESVSKSLNKSPASSKQIEDSSSKQVQIQKRKSKEEKSAKKNAKKFRKADIKFTIDQISSMVDLIRVFQTDIFT